MTIVFRGRPDGLGNRLEEVIKLSALQMRCERLTFRYLWTWTLSLRRDRNYWPRFSSPIGVVPMPLPTFPSKLSQISRQPVAPRDLHAAASQLVLHRSARALDMAIHIRAGDRIRPTSSHPHFMSPSLHNQIVARALEIAACDQQLIGVVSDDTELAAAFCKRLGERGVDAAVVASGDAWGALATLQAAREVVMASSFSSFALLGSLIGSKKVHVPKECRSLDVERYGLEPIGIF